MQKPANTTINSIKVVKKNKILNTNPEYSQIIFLSFKNKEVISENKLIKKATNNIIIVYLLLKTNLIYYKYTIFL